jgi:processive 1,2-diacylglycerol beta-glucosyltransferase
LIPTIAPSRPPRIAICTAAVGCGHTRAAYALRAGLRAAMPGCIVRIIEALDHAPRWFVGGYRDGYLATIARLPRMAGWMYDACDRPSKGLGIGGHIERAALGRFINHPCLARADVVVTTHFLCARVLSDMRKRRLLDAPLVVSVTDQHPHGMWLVPHADRLLVASESARNIAIGSGICATRVHSTGIPIDPAFGAFTDRLAVRRALRLPEDRPIALVCGGGLGLGGMDATVRALLDQPGERHVVAICGNNTQLRDTLLPLACPPRRGEPSCDVLPFTTKMPEYMGAADVMVGKPGGLTTAEAAASSLPMILLRPIPGQEERNAARLVHAGAAALEPDPGRAGAAAAALLTDPPRLRTMRQRAAELGRSRAAADGAAIVLSLAGGSPRPPIQPATLSAAFSA